MAKYVTVKTWVSGEILFAADLNAEFTAVKNAVNVIDLAQMNTGSVGTAQLVDGAVTKVKLGSDSVDESKIDIDTFIRFGSAVTDWDDTNITVVSSFPWTSSAAAVVPLITTAKHYLFGHLELAGVTGEMYRIQIEADRDNDAVFEAAPFSMGGSASGSAIEPFEASGGSANQAHPYNFVALDSGPFTAGVQCNYRWKISQINGSGNIGIKTASLYVVCFNM